MTGYVEMVPNKRKEPMNRHVVQVTVDHSTVSSDEAAYAACP